MVSAELERLHQENEALRSRLADAEVRLSVATDSTEEGILVIDAGNRVVLINERFVEMWCLRAFKSTQRCALKFTQGL